MIKFIVQGCQGGQGDSPALPASYALSPTQTKLPWQDGKQNLIERYVYDLVTDFLSFSTEQFYRIEDTAPGVFL